MAVSSRESASKVGWELGRGMSEVQYVGEFKRLSHATIIIHKWKHCRAYFCSTVYERMANSDTLPEARN